MKKIFTSLVISLLTFTVHAQEELREPPEPSKPSCLSICGKQFLRNLDDNREVLFEKNNARVTQEAKATIEEILRLLSEKDIRQKVVITITAYVDKENSKAKSKQALERAEGIKRYFLMYGFEYKKIETTIKPFICENSQCANYSRKVNINTKGLPEEKVEN